jgi:hypothetical protein
VPVTMNLARSLGLQLLPPTIPGTRSPADAERFGDAAYLPRITPAVSLDHLVGERQQGRRQIQTECLGSPQVDDELKFSRLYNRKVGRFGALENASGVDTGLTIQVIQLELRSSSDRPQEHIRG